jgi:hypothetical protein
MKKKRRFTEVSIIEDGEEGKVEKKNPSKDIINPAKGFFARHH